MNEQLEELLFVDMSERLPFNVIVRHADRFVDNDGNYTGQFWYKRGYLVQVNALDEKTTTIIESSDSDDPGEEHICDLERSVPYLRSLSSMTEKERQEINELIKKNRPEPYGEISHEGMDNLLYSVCVSCGVLLKWLLKHHFDVNGLIPKGLALEAPEDMYD